MACLHESKIEVDAPPPHYRKEVCGGCGAFIRWVPRHGSDRKRPGSHRDLVKKYSRGWCECCLRREENIPAPGCLEAHHVVPFEHGGGNERSNIWIVCTACHRHIEWARTYFLPYGGGVDFRTGDRQDRLPDRQNQGSQGIPGQEESLPFDL